MVRAKKHSRGRMSFFEANKDLLGVFGGPSDLSTNPKYMKGYGK